MRTRMSRSLLALVSVVVLGAAVAAFAGLLGGGSEALAQGARGCQLAESSDGGLAQPDHPLEVNSVVVHEFIKTVVMEKEVFLCTTGEVDEQTVVRDLETFIELVEKKVNVAPWGATPRYELRTFDMQVELARCDKNITLGTVSCRTDTLPLGQPVETALPPGQCTPTASPSDPVEMNTVVFEGFTKTIKVEKEHFFCDPNPDPDVTGDEYILEVYLITEIIEQRRQLPSIGYTMRPTHKLFLGIVCQKDEQAGTIARCSRIAIKNA